MTYVLSDLHGCEHRFYAMLDLIGLQPGDTLYILGDVIDRRPYGLRLIRHIMSMPNAVMILGNHEYMMLQSLGEPYGGANRETPERGLERWYRNGGDYTHRHWKRLRKSLRRQILDYLHGLPVSIDLKVGEKQFKLVHGAPPEYYAERGERYQSAAEFSVWYRLGQEEEFSPDYTLIFGHTPTMHYRQQEKLSPWFGRNVIGIDCGCSLVDRPGSPYNGMGRLCCLRLEDMKEFYTE